MQVLNWLKAALKSKLSSSVAGFLKKPRGFSSWSIKLPALWKVLELAKVSCGQLLMLWELGTQQGGCASQQQAGNSLMAVMKENQRINRKLVLTAGPRETSGSCLSGKSKQRSQSINGFQPCYAEGAQFVQGLLQHNCVKLLKSFSIFFTLSLHLVGFTLSPFWFIYFTTVLTVIVAKSDGGFIRMAISAAGDGGKGNAH